ncbi:hypothetical protein WCX49_04895 [Sulfurimonas sp. HSL-1656]|uniref:hypothetical protein n=1 Tax=Thiomicrolovo subterrani TaxID=3131934 RepID=UPI0031F8173F
MRHETIKRIELLDTGELLLGLESQGKPEYQYVYRDAAGVYWDQERHGFKSTPLKEWSCSQWYKQICDVVQSSLDIELKLAKNVLWSNVPAEEQEEIKHANSI